MWCKGVFLISILIGCLSQACAQDEYKRFHLKGSFSPDAAYRVLGVAENAEIGTTETVINRRNDRELPKFGQTGTVTFCYSVKKFFGFEVGVQYSAKGYRSRWLDFKNGVAYDARYGLSDIFQEGGSVSQVRFSEHFHYLGIPLRANFHIGSSKARFIVGIGLVAEYLVSVQNVVQWEDSNDQAHRNSARSELDYETFNVTPQISFGLDYQINNSMGLIVEPVFRFGLVDVFKRPTTHLWSAGVNLSYYFSWN